ncbi:MAG: GNAT family N-acetyltransferase [Elusimicrobiales bacterium]|jgi:GNAT superfamily N-acetyltransferase
MTPEADEIAIRRVQPEDAGWKRRFKAFYADCPVPRRAPEQEHAYFAAYNGKTIVGHSEIYLEDGKWIMDGLRVKTGFRERGIGKALTGARIAYAAANGAKTVWYNCHDDNLMTTCCHIGFGFKKICPPGHNCTPATAHWYRLGITKQLISRLRGLARQHGCL